VIPVISRTHVVRWTARGFVLVALLATGNSALASYPGTSNGKIAYVYNGVRTMNANGTGKVLLDASGKDPVWSPNGSRIAYVRGNNIWIMNGDGINKIQVTKSPAVERNPMWSPNGAKIRFYSNRTTHGGFYQLNSTRPFGTAGAIYIQSDPDYPNSYVTSGAWSSTGMGALAIAWSVGTCCEVYRGWDASSLRNIYGGMGAGTLGMDWGPKSHTIAFGIYETNPFDPNESLLDSRIATATSDGSMINVITARGDYYFDENPAWAPAGTYMLFDEYHLDQSTGARVPQGIWKMKGDGSGRTRISATGSDPNWQPIP
jgi:Tol biopolymer transport system component